MKRLTSLLLALLALVAMIAGLYVGAANRDAVVIDLLFWPAVSMRSGLLVVLAFVCGALVGMLVTAAACMASARRRQWRLQRQGQHPG